MKKLITALLCSLIGGSAFGQWTPTTFKRGSEMKLSLVRSYYKLDLSKIREQLKNAQETGPNAKPVEISLPTLDGKIEKFAVYSFPVVVKELADQYQLGSYVGVGIDDPTKYLRFSVAPNDFQSMIFKDGNYEFIEPQNADKTVYGVHPKSNPTVGKSFVCTTEEGPHAKEQIDQLLKEGNSFANQPTNFSKTTDKKYRTLRLAISVTGEYTQYFGGTVADALTAINATMTRVNGVFEKDFAVHLNVQNFPGVIYTDASTDPYSPAAQMGNWNLQLQQTLTANVGNANYDIGHLFGASGGGGNAGCIGCVCVNPTSTTSIQKGSGYTSPADAIPEGDNFDIDYVAHEMGHQLGDNHTFSHSLEGTGMNVEPGSGSTIMGYAGITGASTDVQMHSDAYFHKVSIKQVEDNLKSKTCDVETAITNNPPVIAALPTYNIPKGTAFALTASATDPENDPMTYTWEEVDDASVTINKSNLGTTSSGASFRSVAPTVSPTRYFPKFASVMAGVLDNSTSTWESVSMVPRTTKFAVTVRDNNAIANQQQTQSAEQTIIVGNDGPFRVTSQYASYNSPSAITWDVANTNNAPYSVANVKIDYTTDNGTTWTVLAASTANDGTETFSFPTTLNGQTIKVRVSSIGNVFYAVGSVLVTTIAACDGSAPTGVTTSNVTTSSVNVSWAPVSGATYIVRYKKLSETTWQQTSTSSSNITLSNLVDGTAYEVQVATVCSGTPGAYSASANFTTASVAYCTTSTVYTTYEYISNVTTANINNTTTAGGGYHNYTTNPALQINLVKGTTYPISISRANPDYDAVGVWIDYNKDGSFDDTEEVVNFPVTNSAAASTGTFTVPASALENQTLRMRVVMGYAGSANAGLYMDSSFTCGVNFYYGEIEDYNVVVTSALGTRDVANPDNGIQIYPNPVSDVLNVTKVSDKATYKIYSAAGQLVGNGNVTSGKINVSGLIKGGYVITIDEKGKDLFKSKFIKK